MSRKDELFQQAYTTLKEIIEELKELDVFIPEIEIELKSYIRKHISEENH